MKHLLQIIGVGILAGVFMVLAPTFPFHLVAIVVIPVSLALIGLAIFADIRDAREIEAA